MSACLHDVFLYFYYCLIDRTIHLLKRYHFYFSFSTEKMYVNKLVESIMKAEILSSYFHVSVDGILIWS